MDLVTFTEENINGNLDFLSSIFWKTIPFSIERDVFQRYWSKGLTYAFPSFNVIGRVLAKVQRKKVTILVPSAWQTQTWFPKLLEMAIQNPTLLSSYPGLLTNPKREFYSLLLKQFVRLVACTVSGKSYLQKEFQEGPPISSPKQQEWEPILIANRSEESLIVGVVKDRLISLDVV